MGKRWSEQDVPDLDGKIAVVTGSNSGLGEEAAAVLARHGATVVLACRNQSKAEAAAARMRAGGATGTIDLVALDLASLASVRKASEEIVDRYGRLDILVNN